MFDFMSSPNTRKRPAPGAGPTLPLTQFQQPFVTSAPDPVPRWNGGVPAATDFADTSRNISPFMMSAPNQLPAQGYQAAPSTAIARRPNRALVPTVARASYDAAPDGWNSFGDEAALIQSAAPGPVHEHDNIQLLEEKAARAKREAQANRKQIPPFVQKLSSFLEEHKNTDLIRWSEKGDSFIVLDEDEFAKTLIPELFKHNNYASFVRQLNMYGFHKRVGLSDNSMKASERKNKSPSEYYNPYFKRGHPNLLWLINKPKGGANKRKGKKEDGEGDSEEEAANEDAYVSSLPGPTPNPPRSAAHHPGHLPGEVGGALQRKDLQLVKDQLGQIQQQQKAISTMITRLRQDHNQLYQQAMAFQNMHERHENSINAILNFLANVFRKSLEEQGGAQSVSELLASIIPTAAGAAGTQIPQGSVFDLGDIFHQQADDGSRPTTVSPPRGSRRLLPPPVAANGQNTGGGRVSTVASSPAPSAASPYTGQMGSVTELFDTTPAETTATSPSYLKDQLQSNPQEGMMKIINDTNAGSPAGAVDLSGVAAQTSVNMSRDQRNKMLSMMARQGAPSTQHPPVSTQAPIHAPLVTPTVPATSAPITPSFTAPSPAPVTPATTAAPSMPLGSNVPTPTAASPVVPARASSNSLSPLMSSMPPPPSLHELSMTEAELEALQRLQDDQRHKIDELSHLLGPLSPSGRVPGIDENGHPTQGGYFPDNIDLDQYLDPSAFASHINFDNDLGGAAGAPAADDFNFNLDMPFDPTGGTTGAESAAGALDQFPVGHVETQSNTPSSATTEEMFRTDLAESPARDSKRRRIG